MPASAPPRPRVVRVLLAHRALVDAIVVAVFVAIPTVGFAFNHRGGRHGLDAADVVAALVLAPLVFVRRRWPLPALGAGALAAAAITVASGERTVALPACVVLLFTVASRVPRTIALRAGAAAAFVLFVAAAARLDHQVFTPDSFAVLAWSGLALAAGDAVRNRRAYVLAVEERARRAEASRETEAQRRVAEERLRIARELHDVVAHHMAVINVQAGVAAHLLRTSPDDADRALRTVRDAGRSVLDELGGLLSVLRSTDDEDAPAQPLPTLAQLDSLIGSFADAGLTVSFTTTGAVPAVPDAVQLTAYRVIEEALTNAHKHGDGEAAVRCTYAPSGIDIDVTNRVAPTIVVDEPEGRAEHGFGLIGMRERVLAVHGSIEARQVGTAMFAVHAHLPLSPTDPHPTVTSETP